MEAAGGAVCVRGVRAGAASRPFPAAALLRALQDPALSSTVYVDVDAAGWLVARGAAAGGAALCVRAALAPNVHARSAALCLAPARLQPRKHRAEPHLQLVVTEPRAPHEELRVWPDERLRAALQLPHLAPDNIRGDKEYRCGACGARFPEPNPLKAHMFLGCSEPAPRRFWRGVAARLAPPPPPPSPARLEALAAEWGRARGAGGAHACLYCGKAYSRKYGLKIHIRTHTGYRPLRCGHCARAFADPSNLNKHVRLHAARARPLPLPPSPEHT